MTLLQHKLVAGVAHEVNNPLATISLNAQILARSEDEVVRKRAATITRMVERANRICKSLLAFSRESPPNRQTHCLNEIVASALELCASSTKSADVNLRLQLAEKAPKVLVDESHIEQILVNLVNNAVYAMKETPGRDLCIATGIEDDMAFVRVADQGVGIPQDIQGRIFDPFFTTKPIGEGTGLGLPVCHGLANANFGGLTFTSKVAEGTTFVLKLPLGVSS